MHVPTSDLASSHGSHRCSTSTGLRETSVDGGRDPLSFLAAKVLLGVVEPDHGPRLDPVQVGQRGVGPNGVERMP